MIVTQVCRKEENKKRRKGSLGGGSRELAAGKSSGKAVQRKGFLVQLGSLGATAFLPSSHHHHCCLTVCSIGAQFPSAIVSDHRQRKKMSVKITIRKNSVRLCEGQCDAMEMIASKRDGCDEDDEIERKCEKRNKIINRFVGFCKLKILNVNEGKEKKREFGNKRKDGKQIQQMEEAKIIEESGMCCCC